MIEVKNRVMYRIVRSDIVPKTIERMIEVRSALQNAIGLETRISSSPVEINVGLAHTLVEIIDQAIDAERRLA